MFNNCRQYNEEGSVIYEDANRLERLLSSSVIIPSEKRFGARGR